MNYEALRKLIQQYEDNFELINNKEHDEIFKWKATQKFRDIWFSDDSKDLAFSERFKLAMNESSVMINNSAISPTSGIIKLAEIYPIEIEALFNKTLFSGETDPETIQDKMDYFLSETERLRQNEFPGFYRYKQERHAASCYLFFYDPSCNFVYRYREAEEMALHLEYGKDLGSGENFSLKNYYELADIIANELKKHVTLIEKHNKLIENLPEYFRDENLHLMAFDLMYCCRAYNYYSDMDHKSKKEILKNYNMQQLREKEERERQEEIESLEKQIYDLDLQLDGFSDISLINVMVNQKTYGDGIIIEQDFNKIKVDFGSVTKSYTIHNKYPIRPTFENDKETVDLLSEYADIKESKVALEKKLQRIIATN